MGNLDNNLEKLVSDPAINSLIETVKNLKQDFEIELPNQYRLLYDELAKVGWYIDYNLAPRTIADLILLDPKDMSYLDHYLINYFKSLFKNDSANFL